MLRIASGVDGAPTVLLSAALRDTAPDLHYPGLSADHPFGAALRDRHHADLTIQPRSSHPYSARPMTADAWYDLVWTHPTIDLGDPWDTDGSTMTVEHTAIEVVGQLPAPPRIPAAQRIAAAPPVTIDHLSPESVAMYGGADKVLADATRQRDAAIEQDTSADTYDWPAYAVEVATIVRRMTPPKLTTEQRAQVALVRLLRARWEAAAAHASVTGLVANLGTTETGLAAAARILDLADRILPTPVPARPSSEDPR